MRRHPFGVALAVTLPIAIAAAWIAVRDLPQLAPDAGSRLRGVFHVHSDAGHDGRVPADELIAAAGRLGLDFIVFTEHNLVPDHASPPGGPLVVPGTELSTPHGHLIVLGADQIPPRGAPRRDPGLLDSLAARGALTVAAHPGSPKRPWTGPVAGIGGLEIASSSADARYQAGEQYAGIIAPLLAYTLNPRLALAQLYRRDDAVLRRWDRLSDPSVVGLCGTDAHGWVDPAMNFRTWQVSLDPWLDPPDPLTAAAVIARIAAGRFICVAGLVADQAPRFTFRARTADGFVPQGQRVRAAEVASLDVVTGADGAGSMTTVLLRDGAEVASTDGPVLQVSEPRAGTYRVEVRMRIPGLFGPGRIVPVIYSNRIRLTR